MNRAWIFLFLAAMVGAAFPGCAGNGSTGSDPGSSAQERRFDPSLSDPRAIEIAEQVLAAMGGREGFERAAYLTFHFVVQKEDGEIISNYTHHWDRKNDRYRLEGSLKDGRNFLSYFQLWSGVGSVYLDGKELDQIGVPDFIKRFHGRFINDTYWLLMPAKLLDPGAILKYAGEITDDSGEQFDIVHISFLEGTGLTWQDQYWAFVNRKTHLMDRWEYVLTGSPPEDRQVALWTDWKPHGPLILSTLKTFPDRPYHISFTDLEVRETVPEEIFSPPGRVKESP